MANYSPFVKPNYTAKDGTTPLYIRYNYSRVNRTLIKTGYSIKPEHWDDKKKWVKRASHQFEVIDALLTKMITRLGNILTYAKENNIDPTVEYVLIEIEKEKEYIQRSNRVDIFEAIDKYIEEQRPIVCTDRVKDYKSFKKHLTSFKEHSSQPITFRNLNSTFYNEFVDFLSNKVVKPDGGIGLLTNSAGKVIRILKAFVNHQVDKGVIPTIDLKKFKVLEEETDAIYLTETELSIIQKLNLSDDIELERIRDIFLVGCYTGLRYGDLSNLHAENIDHINGFIHIKQRKVHRAVIIPFLDPVPQILEKYNYSLPSINSQKFNARLKEIGKMAKLTQRIEIVRKKGQTRVQDVYKKWELISSHTCRRSFCTNMYLSGFPADELMKISGHKNTDAFKRYIKIDNQEAASRLKALRNRIK